MKFAKLFHYDVYAVIPSCMRKKCFLKLEKITQNLPRIRKLGEMCGYHYLFITLQSIFSPKQHDILKTICQNSCIAKLIDLLISLSLFLLLYKFLPSHPQNPKLQLFSAVLRMMTVNQNNVYVHSSPPKGKFKNLSILLFENIL